MSIMDNPKRISIKDIAKHVGVSTALVSYVLNGLEKEKRVSPELTKKIREAVKEFNYTPSHFARSLRKGNTMTIGLIVADIANPFFSHLARHIESEAFKHGYNVIIGSSNEDCHILETLIDAFIDRQVDGFIIVPTEKSEDQIQRILNKNIPLVLIDRYFQKLNTNYVVLNNYKASYDGVSHLIENNHKRIGMIAYKTSLIHMQERIRGYKAAMKENNLQDNIRVEKIRFDNLKEDVKKCIDIFRKKGEEYDALIVATNNIAITTLYELNDRKIVIPDQLAIVSFDSSEAFDFFYSPITYIKQPLEEIGINAVNLLISKMKDNSSAIHLEIEFNLIVRSSSK